MFFKFKPHLIAFILVVATVFSVPGGIFASEIHEDAGAFPSESEFLEKLGITDGSMQEDSILTRAQACSMAVRMQNYTHAAESAQSVYADVRKEDKYFNDILNASALGIVNGHSGSLFMPDSEVTYMQFYKMIIQTLGYGDFALVGGGYPVGYLNLVNSLDIDDGVNAGLDDAVKFSDAVRIICNSLNTDVCNVDSVYDYEGEAVLDYHTRDGETLLSKYFDIEKASGIICGTPISSLTSGVAGVSEGEILLDETKFTGALPQDYEKLGYCADVYYTDKNKIFFVAVNSFENRIKKIDANAIVDFNAATNTYEYEINERIYREALSKTVDVIINEKACPGYTKADMIPSSGEVVLVDNNNDGKTDVVKITSYQHYVVGGVDTVNGIIYAKNRSDIVSLDTEEGNVIVSYADSNKEFSLADIKNDVVLSIAKSSDEDEFSYAKVYVSSKEVSGEISEVAGDFEYIGLGGEIFDVNKDYAKTLLQNGKIVPSVYAVLRINAFGEVVYADTDAVKGKKYGFLLDVSKPQGGITQKYSVRLIDSDSEIVIFDCKETITLNQERIDVSKLEEKLGYTFAPGNVHTIRQLVTYETNASDILTAIETFEDFGKNRVSGIHVRGDLFGKGTRLTSDVPVFVVPDDENINTTDIKSGFTVLKASDVENDSSRTMEFFNYNDLRFAEAAVDYVAFGSKTAKIDGEYPLMLIDRATTVFDEDGNEILKITGTVSGKQTEEVLYDEFITYRDREGALMQTYTPKSGDVIIYSKNTVGRVNCIYVFFTKEDLNKGYFIHSTHSAKRYDHMMTVVSGRVTQYAYGKDVVMESTDILASDVTGATFSILTDKGFDSGTPADLSIGDFVVARLRYGVVKEVVIIRL